MATTTKTRKAKLAPIADYFRATGAQLRAAVEAGDEQAIAEVARRAAKREAASA